MDTLSYKTISSNRETVNKEWVLIDAQDQVLGRLSAKVASMIRGKHKTNFSPHVDCGDNIIIINAEKVKLTGNKVSVKEYIHHTGYPGGQRFATPKELLQKDPARIIKIAVKGMLPKNRLGRTLNGNLFVYAGPNHPHEAQQPKKLDINSL
ncbi:MAG: 50S ribosomal protein L13 [Bacteroidota bacterium]